MACPIWKGHNILGSMVIHISLQSSIFKTQVGLKKIVQRIILRENGGKAVREHHSSMQNF